jgi:uncharacterized protein (DUF952 family)
MALIFHIAEKQAWEDARSVGLYRASTLGSQFDEVGFIHCSRREQVERVANAAYRRAGPLVLLIIDPSLAGCEVKEEAAQGEVESFPHLYGPLPIGAVIAAEPLEPAPGGLFVPPVSWVSPKLEVARSPIRGLGLFATEPIGSGEPVSVMGGQAMTDPEFARHIAGLDRWSAAAIDEGLNVLQAEGDPLGRGNHSCEPSLWMADELTLVTREPLVAGREATVDYALMTVDEGWRMECRCGSAACRGVVTGADWRRPELQVRYRGHFSPFIERRIRADAADPGGP